MMIDKWVVPGFVVGHPGYDGKVSVLVESPWDDLSGNTDSTQVAYLGIKPKKLMVEFSLQSRPKGNAKLLSELVEMFEAKDSSGSAADQGDKKRYNITHPLAAAMRIRQASFAGKLNVEQDNTLFVWHVSFTLLEYKSAPEAVAARDLGNDPTLLPGQSMDDLIKSLDTKDSPDP